MAKLAPKDFFEKYWRDAVQTQIKYGVPSSITLAQAAIESGWGGSGLTLRANNFFGIKDQLNDEWKGDFTEVSTREEKPDGTSYYVISKFRKYKTPEDSFEDHAKFLVANKRYKSLFVNSNYKDWANGLQKAGYATANQYGASIIRLIELYGLQKYDDVEVYKKKL